MTTSNDESRRTYAIRVWIAQDADGLTVYAADLPGCVSDGNTIEECLSNIKEAFIDVAQVYLDDNRVPIPFVPLAERSSCPLWSEERRIVITVPTPSPNQREELRSKIERTDHGEFLVVLKLGEGVLYVREFGQGIRRAETQWSARDPKSGDFFGAAGKWNKDQAIRASEDWLIAQAIQAHHDEQAAKLQPTPPDEKKDGPAR